MATNYSQVALRQWDEGDLPLLERLLGTAEMTRYLGGPESPEQLLKRHRRYVASRESDSSRVFVMVVGEGRTPAGSVGYWEQDEGEETVWEATWSVLPEFQGRGLATRGIEAVIERARAENRHRFMHAYSSVDNGPSNALCRKLGFELIGEVDFDYPPGNPVRGNEWRFDLYAER